MHPRHRRTPLQEPRLAQMEIGSRFCPRAPNVLSLCPESYHRRLQKFQHINATSSKSPVCPHSLL